MTLSALKRLRFLRNFVLNIPIARVPGRNPVAKNGGLLSLSFNKLLKRLGIYLIPGFAESPRTFDMYGRHLLPRLAPVYPSQNHPILRAKTLFALPQMLRIKKDSRRLKPPVSLTSHS